MLTNENLHYLDNAATTIPSPEVVAAVSKSLSENWANPSSLYTPGLENAQLLNRCRAAVAKTLGCTPAELYFTGCGSESNNIALLGAAHTRQGWGKRIIVSGFEHPSVQLPLRRLAEEGFEVLEVAPEKDGHLNVEKMAELVNKSTILVACMLVNNELGTRVEVEKLAKMVKTANPRTAVHVDAVQGWMRVGFKLDHIDSLSVSGHKIHAPKGVGALFLRKGYSQGMKLPLLGGGQEKGVRPGTENIAYAVGLATAAGQMQAGFKQRAEHLAALNQRLREGLAAIPGVTLNSPADAVSEVVNLSENCIRSQTMLNYLAEKQIYVSSGSACSKGEASHTLTAMGCSPLTIDTALRVSFCGENTEADVDAFLNGLESGIKTLSHIRGH